MRGCSQLQKFALYSAPTDYKAKVWTTEVTEVFSQRPWPWTIHTGSTEEELAVAVKFSKLFSKQCLPVRIRSPSHWYMLNIFAGAKTWVDVFILACVYIIEPDYCLKLCISQFFKRYVQGNSIRSRSCCFRVGFLNMLRSQTLLRYHMILPSYARVHGKAIAETNT